MNDACWKLCRLKPEHNDYRSRKVSRATCQPSKLSDRDNKHGTKHMNPSVVTQRITMDLRIEFKFRDGAKMQNSNPILTIQEISRKLRLHFKSRDTVCAALPTATSESLNVQWK